MSWNVQKISGTPEKVKEAAMAAFDQQHKTYVGKPEGTDILNVQASVGAWIDEAAAAGNKGVQVEASGSRGASWLTIKVDCATINLLT